MVLSFYARTTGDLPLLSDLSPTPTKSGGVSRVLGYRVSFGSPRGEDVGERVTRDPPRPKTGTSSVVRPAIGTVSSDPVLRVPERHQSGESCPWVSEDPVELQLRLEPDRQVCVSVPATGMNGV